jgi:hypothetical protein
MKNIIVATAFLSVVLGLFSTVMDLLVWKSDVYLLFIHLAMFLGGLLVMKLNQEKPEKVKQNV